MRAPEAHFRMRRRSSLSGYRTPAWAVRVLCVLLWLAMAFLLAYRLDDRPPAKAEVDAISLVRSTPEATLEACAQANEPPLFPLALSLSRIHSLENLTAARWLSLFFGWMTLLAGYRLLRRVVAPGMFAIVFCALFATSPFWLPMSRMATGHSLFALCALGSTAFLFHALAAPRWYLWIGYMALAVAMFYADVLAPAVMAGQAAAGLFRKHWTPARKTYGRPLVMILCMAVVLALSLPGLPVWLDRLRAAQSQPSAGGLDLPWVQHAGLSTGYMMYMFMVGDTIPPWNILRTVMFVLPAMLCGAFGIVRIFERRHRTLRSALMCALVSYVCAMLMTAWLFHDMPPLMAPLHMAFLYPFFLLAAAYGLGVMNKWLSVPLLAVLIGVHGFSLRNYYEQREYTNWAYVIPIAQTLDAIKSHEQPGTLLAVDETTLGHFASLYEGSLPVWPIDARSATVDRLSREFSNFSRILWLRPGGNGDLERVDHALEQHFTLREMTPFVVEDAVANEIKSFLSGRTIPRTKYSLLVYERKP